MLNSPWTFVLRLQLELCNSLENEMETSILPWNYSMFQGTCSDHVIVITPLTLMTLLHGNLLSMSSIVVHSAQFYLVGCLDLTLKRLGMLGYSCISNEQGDPRLSITPFTRLVDSSWHFIGNRMVLWY